MRGIGQASRRIRRAASPHRRPGFLLAVAALRPFADANGIAMRGAPCHDEKETRSNRIHLVRSCSSDGQSKGIF